MARLPRSNRTHNPAYHQLATLAGSYPGMAAVHPDRADLNQVDAMMEQSASTLTP